MFTAEQFIPTEWNTAEDKAWFANHFIRFVQSDFNWSIFYKKFYTRLMNTFGHIAHYNRLGFYETFFTKEKDKERFIAKTLAFPCYGQPEYTYCDVEKVLIEWLEWWLQTQPKKATQAEMKL